MNIAILGAGNSGCALAADYAARGHEVTLIKTSHSLHDDNFSHLCATGGRMRIHEFGTDTACVIAHLSRDVADVRGKDIVLLCTQTGYHPDVLRRVVPFLTPGQILLMIPGYLSTAYALGLHPADGVIFAEAESNFIDGRIGAPGEFQVGFRNVRNPIGVYPHNALPAAREVLDRLGTPFVYLKSVAEAALHNPNMIVHTVGAVMSIPRIEATHGDFCMYHEAFTPSTWNLLEALDGEAGLQLGLTGDPDLILLDVMLPDIDGFEVCRRIRATGSKMGILMLSAKSQEMDKITGLMTGADDYVTKPFSPAELLARVDALYRRIGGSENTEDVLSSGPFVLHLRSRTLDKNLSLIHI